MDIRNNWYVYATNVYLFTLFVKIVISSNVLRMLKRDFFFFFFFFYISDILPMKIFW